MLDHWAEANQTTCLFAVCRLLKQTGLRGRLPSGERWGAWRARFMPMSQTRLSLPSVLLKPPNPCSGLLPPLSVCLSVFEFVARF